MNKDVEYLAELAFSNRNRETIGHLSHSQQIALALIFGRAAWLKAAGFDPDDVMGAYDRIGDAWGGAIAQAREVYILKANAANYS